ncbi:lipase [Fennellomyces sp. T-0311]|nr:lipase [Fennellomyces sp. T-0311]
MKLTFVALAITCILLPLAAARPVYIKRQDYDPEATGLERNGPLPADEDQNNGLAYNATEYPDTVAEALARELRASGVRQATAGEIEEHKFLTKMSAAAYCRDVIPGGKYRCKNCDRSLTLVKTFTTLLEDTNAMILRGDNQKGIYVVFRGTSSVRSGIVDAQFVPVNYPVASGTKVHKGFLDSYNAVRDDLLAVLDNQVDQYPDYKVVVTGHSLGGAQALLCALDLFNIEGGRYGLNRLSLFTQGQPRVGDPAFADYVISTNIPYERLVNKRDIVPHVPPGIINFLHAGEEFWITEDDVVQVCPNGIETDNCGNSIVPFTSLLDHVTYLGINTGLCL